MKMNKKNQYSKLKLFLNKIKKYYDMFDKKFLTVFLGMFLFSGVTKAIEIIPSTYVYQLSALGTTQDVTFYNRKDKPERIKVSFKPFREDKDERYLGKWGTIYPRVITVPPRGQKSMKFSIEPPAGLPKGEYRALLYMEELEQKALNPEGKVILKEGTSSSQISMLVNLGVVVYGYSGDRDSLKVSGKVSGEKVKKDEIEFTLENDGEISNPYTLVFEGTRKDGSPRIQNTDIMVVQGYKEKVKMDFPEDMNVKKIHLKDSKGNILKVFK